MWTVHWTSCGDRQCGRGKKVLYITIERFLKERKIYNYCNEALTAVSHTTSLFDIEKDSVMVRRAPLNGALQNLVLVLVYVRESYTS